MFVITFNRLTFPSPSSSTPLPLPSPSSPTPLPLLTHPRSTSVSSTPIHFISTHHLLFLLNYTPSPISSSPTFLLPLYSSPPPYLSPSTLPLLYFLPLFFVPRCPPKPLVRACGWPQGSRHRHARSHQNGKYINLQWILYLRSFESLFSHHFLIIFSSFSYYYLVFSLLLYSFLRISF